MIALSLGLCGGLLLSSWSKMILTQRSSDDGGNLNFLWVTGVNLLLSISRGRELMV